MTYQVLVSPRASRQLLAHMEFLARKSVPAARRLSAEYKVVIRALKTNPYQFPIDLDSELEDPPRTALFARRYKLYFDVEDHCVYVAAVRDCRQRPE